MKAIMVMFDSLNKHMLPNYGCDWTHAPNFKRLGEKTVTFENSYVGSLPCMPARRELHTGRYNFLHRSWGPMEPFDDSMPEILKRNGIYSHLVSDHQHYWEDGGCTYHTRYSSWEISRGQEGDAWKGHKNDPEMQKTVTSMPKGVVKMMEKKFAQNIYRQDAVNRLYMDKEENMPQHKTFKYGLEFIETNHKDDDWFLQIETFDPHEPFFASQRFRDLYPDADYEGDEFDWPPYSPVNQKEDKIDHCRKRYAALLSMCDYYLGQVLDKMDEYNLWEDTMLIVNTDHGFLLGEHGWWGKSIMPIYNEVANTPFFVWDPRAGISNKRRSALVQTIDIAPTLLDFFNIDIPSDMKGKPLNDVIQSDVPIRETALFGYHGGYTNITDGCCLYMRAPINRSNKPINEYTLMPTHMRCMFGTDELQDIELEQPFEFTKGCKTMKIAGGKGHVNPAQFGSKLFDLKCDPNQTEELEDLEKEVELINQMKRMMIENEAPIEQFQRMGIPVDGDLTVDVLKEQKQRIKDSEVIDAIEAESYEQGAYNQIVTLLNLIPEPRRQQLIFGLNATLKKMNISVITKQFVLGFIMNMPIEDEQKEMLLYFIRIAGRIN